jgi:hypothetical protein
MNRLGGWHPDLFGSNEYRWFVDGIPTSHVRNSGNETEDVLTTNQGDPGVSDPVSSKDTLAALPPKNTRRKFAVIAAVVVLVGVGGGIAVALTPSHAHTKTSTVSAGAKVTKGRSSPTTVPISTNSAPTLTLPKPSAGSATTSSPTRVTQPPTSTPSAPTPVTQPAASTPPASPACPSGSPSGQVSVASSSVAEGTGYWNFSLTGTVTNTFNTSIVVFGETAQVVDASGNALQSQTLTPDSGTDVTLDPGQSTSFNNDVDDIETSSSQPSVGAVTVSWSWAEEAYFSCPSGPG